MGNKILCTSCLNFIPIISWWCKEENAVEFHGRRCSSIHGGCCECPFYIRISFDYMKGIRWIFAESIRKSYLKKLKKREIERILQINPCVFTQHESFIYLLCKETYYDLRLVYPNVIYRKEGTRTFRRWWNYAKRNYKIWKLTN